MKSRAFVFFTGFLLGGLATGGLVGWLVDRKNDREDQFAAHSALLPQVIVETITTKWPHLKADQVTSSVNATLATDLIYLGRFLNPTTVSFESSESSRVSLFAMERSEDRVVLQIVLDSDPPSGLGARGYNLEVKRGADGTWTGKVTDSWVS